MQEKHIAKVAECPLQSAQALMRAVADERARSPAQTEDAERAER